MKKYLYGALALPLLFACSAEDLTEKEVISNNQFAGIEKVDATFFMDEGPATRMDKGLWAPEEGDLWGFAWLGEGSKVSIDGTAYQNHNLIQTDGAFKPQTSIYVGKYYLYRPYDETTVSPQAINFKSLEEQPLADGYASSLQPWKDLAKTAINIADKWSEVTTTGYTKKGSNLTWGKAGIDQHYEIYPAFFSNQTGLDLTYEKNNVTFAAAKNVKGATDIDITYEAGTEVGAANITKVDVTLAGAAKSFTYAPTTEPNRAAHSGTFWAEKTNLGTSEGFTFTEGAITLVSEDGVSTDKEDNKGWFWFNSLPVTKGNAAVATTTVTPVLETTYGTVTINTKNTLADVAYVLDKYDAKSAGVEWIKLATADDATKTPKEWQLSDDHKTFVNHYGNHRGKYAFTVDFSKGVMNDMHIKNDAHLQQLLKYYIASGKDETVVLNLDGASATDKTFKLSKISIALLQTINASENKILVKPCKTDNTPKIIITQDGQTGDLASATEVPALRAVFKQSVEVYLSKDYNWTWSSDDKLKIGGNVKSIINEGTLTVNATNVELSNAASTLKNAAGATTNITKVTTVKNALTNLGTINVGDASNTSAELRAYNIEITNDATDLDAYGVINNYGVVGVSDIGTAGKFNNYGYINMMNDDAITLLTSNELGTKPFGTAFTAASNKMGTVVLPENNPTALVSVNNEAENGFIKYTWTGATYATPAGNVKYNTIVVSSDIKFTTTAEEVQYIEFNGTRTQVVNPATSNKLTKLKGIIVNDGKSIIIEKSNKIECSDGTYLGAGATVYKGGEFTHGATVTGTTASNYFGTWETTQIVKY